MRALLVKLTSMGDLIHALPAITDATRVIPDLTFDWVIDKNFSEVAMWHPAVKKIIPTSHRKWKKNFWKTLKNKELYTFVKTIRQKKYDVVIDGQSSLKSAMVMLLTKGERHGFDQDSTREGFVSRAYNKRHFVPRGLHAITRLRMLFAATFQYPYPNTPPDYHILNYPFPPLTFELPKPYVMCVHNASWSTKMWPERHWRELMTLAAQDGLHVVLPWGNEAEKQRAIRISEGLSNAHVLPFCSLSEQAQILKNSQGALCSDTGLSHLAAALNMPAVTLYGPTDIHLIGTTGLHQQHLVSPFVCTLCYKQTCRYLDQTHPEPLCLLEITPQRVWEKFCTARGV